MTTWAEVADRVYQRRYDPLDVSVCVVRGADGLLLVDTRSSHREADDLRADLHVFAGRGVRWPAHLEAYERPLLDDLIARGVEPVDDWRDVVITPPDVLIDDQATLDVGDRGVDLLHLGRGHTDNDLVISVPDARAWLVGDLVEESGPPMYGSGSFPLEWPTTVGRLLRRITADAIVVPGH